MYFQSNLFAQLADRIRGGDIEAREEMRQELESVLLVMVRQTLRSGKSTSSMGRRILAAARRLNTVERTGHRPPDDFEREVAQHVCDEVVARLQPGPDGFAPGDSLRLGACAATLVMA